MKMRRRVSYAIKEYMMFKSLLFVAVLSLGAVMTFAAPSHADQSGALLASSDGSSLGSTGPDSRYPVNPETGKRDGVLDWNGTGRDVSRHPDGPRHDFATCGICK